MSSNMSVRVFLYLFALQAEEVFDEVENDSVMQKLWEAYRKKFSYASDLEWDVIMKAIRRLYVLCEKGISL